MDITLKKVQVHKMTHFAVIQITNNYIGKWANGYVAVPKGHPWYEKDYDNIPVETHGGLTYADYELPRNFVRRDDVWWIGFDTVHGFETEHEQSVEYCVEQCKSIIDQMLDVGGISP